VSFPKFKPLLAIAACLLLAPLPELRAQTGEFVGPEASVDKPPGETKSGESPIDDALLDEGPDASSQGRAEDEPSAAAPTETTPAPKIISAAEKEVIEDRRIDEAMLNEDPEAQRRALARATAASAKAAPEAGQLPPPPEPKTSLDLYASARVHDINTFDPDTGDRRAKIGDGNSRLGARAGWQYNPRWALFGRAEFGYDLVAGLTSRSDLFSGEGLNERLMFAGLDSDHLTVVYGKNWSSYYQIAGLTDRFAVFGGSASGVYNAGSAGQFTGTGRADDALQARISIQSGRGITRGLKPFNLHMQYQQGQPIPFGDGVNYERSYGASALFETEREFTLGIAYNRAEIPESQIEAGLAGIDGDAEALAIATRAYGERWYVGILVSRLHNMEVTNEQRYYNGTGVELYAQYEFRKHWWLIGGANWLQPDADDPDSGQFEVKYSVIGGRYSFDSFKHMLYIEYRIDNSRLTNGQTLKDEVTLGVRWDFGD
jgi:outer membrane protein N